MVTSWEGRLTDRRDAFPYRAALDEILFHADLRFVDYLPFQNDGAFRVRLLDWLRNMESERDRKALFKLLLRLVFLDKKQMLCLYREAFRSAIVPWLLRVNAIAAQRMLLPGFDLRIRRSLAQCRIYSITESFGFPEFLQVNDLVGLRKPRSFQEDPANARSVRPVRKKTWPPIIVLEDFVGTGKQALAVLTELLTATPANVPVLFVPLIILERGADGLRPLEIGGRFTFEPILVVPKQACVEPDIVAGEDAGCPTFRALIRASSARVLEPLNGLDDPPASEFGYKGCGALLVTHHNAPNNTLPLFHHRAPTWRPLFRRLHHSKDGLR